MTFTLRSITVLSVCFCASAVLGCGDDERHDNNQPKGCSVESQTGCTAGLVCEEVDGKVPGCFAPLSFKGRVFDIANDQGIDGARVVARDANDAAVSTVAVTDVDGTYTLTVPSKRDSAGTPLMVSYTLRADAMGYQTFPKAPRLALPIDLTTATGDPPIVESAATDVGLIKLPNASGLGWISGEVLAPNPGGTLIVAGGVTGVADRDGNYVVYNITPGSAIDVHGYAAGIQLDPETVAVLADAETSDVDLRENERHLATISGKVEIVNPGDGKDTSIVLAVEETFNATAARGEVPRGLRVGGVSGDWVIPDVPDGRYVVLAAFENDFLVRDPDTSIGGTEIVHIVVDGTDQPLSQSFKVTGALGVVSPGASELEEVMGTPTFVWEDDSSEDGYELRVFDALGNLTWENTAVPSVSGSKTVSLDYAGTALQSGMIYQFRAMSIKSGVPISATEDLKGVFLYR